MHLQESSIQAPSNLAPQNAKFDFVARNQIVAIVDGEAVTTTGTIAHETGNEHASVIALVRKYQADFSEFGGCDSKSNPSRLLAACNPARSR